MDAYDLLKYLKGASTPKEEADIRHWLAEDPDGSRRALYREMHNVFNGMTLSLSEAREAPVRQRRFLRKLALWAGGAAAAVALFAGVAVHERHVAEDRLASRMETIRVPQGKSLQMDLEDGTKIWLNSDTEIERPAAFGRKERRLVVRSGEVLLDVAKDEKRPFYVETFASTIRVLGTRLDVDVDEQMQRFSVTLLRGRILAQPQEEGEAVAMKPGDRLSYEKGVFTRSRVTNWSSVDCWTDGLIDVSDTPFDALMRKFEKAYNVRILVDREELPTISYTRGKVRVSDGIDHALQVLQVASDFSYTRDYETNTIIIN